MDNGRLVVIRYCTNRTNGRVELTNRRFTLAPRRLGYTFDELNATRRTVAARKSHLGCVLGSFLDSNTHSSITYGTHQVSVVASLM